MACLIVKDNNKYSTKSGDDKVSDINIALTKLKKMTIGRDADANVLGFPIDRRLSSKHCNIYYYRDADKYVLSDNKSTNGTLLNKNKIVADITLSDNDEIKCGNITIIFKGETEGMEVVQTHTAKTIKNDLLTTETQAIPTYAETVYEEEGYTHNNINYKAGYKIDEYVIISKIKEFKYGTVYIAKHFETREKVAIKIFAKDFSKNDTAFNSLVEKMQRISRLDFDGLVKYLNVGIVESYCYIDHPRKGADYNIFD